MNFLAGKHDNIGDKLTVLQGGTSQAITHIEPGPDGNRGFWVGGNLAATFDGIEPLDVLDVNANEITVNLPHTGNHAVLRHLTSAGGQLQLQSVDNTFEQTLVQIPLQYYRLNGEGGDDLIELIDETGQALATSVVIHGNAGDDTLDLRAFPHFAELFGDEDNDVFRFGQPNFAKLDGGAGIDTLEIAGGGVVFDATLLAASQMTNIERIDVRGSGNNRLRLNHASVEAIVGVSGALDVLGDADDILDLSDNWRFAGTEIRDGLTYRIWEPIGGNAIVRTLGPLSVHTQLPTVISTSFRDEGTLPTGSTAFTVTFSEPVVCADLLPAMRYSEPAWTNGWAQTMTNWWRLAVSMLPALWRL